MSLKCVCGGVFVWCGMVCVYVCARVRVYG